MPLRHPGRRDALGSAALGLSGVGGRERGRVGEWVVQVVDIAVGGEWEGMGRAERKGRDNLTKW